jgi:hypothetical protein
MINGSKTCVASGEWSRRKGRRGIQTTASLQLEVRRTAGDNAKLTCVYMMSPPKWKQEATLTGSVLPLALVVGGFALSILSWIFVPSACSVFSRLVSTQVFTTLEAVPNKSNCDTATATRHSPGFP